jgi:glycosyltransferase involved in cell wall biosynthesis
MRIALVANAYPPWFIGGAEIAAHRQAVELVRRGHALSCFCAWSNPSQPAYDVTLHEVDGVAVTRINVPGFRFEADRNFANGVVDALFARFLERENPQVAHFHNLPGLSLGLLDVAEAAGAPSMVTFHDHWGFCLRHTLVRAGEARVCPDWDGCEVCLPAADLDGAPLPTFMRTSLVRTKLHKADRFHFPSAYLMAAYGAAGFDLERARRHTYGVAPDWFAGEAARAPRRPLEVAFVAYLGPHKGPDVLLDALERVEAAGRLEALRVGFHGGGALEGEIAARIARQGWEGRVVLHGKRSPGEIMAVFRAADLMVNCSLWPENEPVTLLESLACGTPVVATAMGGNLELVRQGVNGWLTPAGDAQALAARLIALADAPEALAALRPGARASVADRTLGAYADFAEATYAELQPVPAQRLPSIVAVADDPQCPVDGAALKRVARMGAWADAEWLPAEALRGPAERGAVRAVVAFGGALEGEARAAAQGGVPAFAVGRRGLAALGGAPDLRYVPDLAALAAEGARRAAGETDRVLERA